MLGCTNLTTRRGGAVTCIVGVSKTINNSSNNNNLRRSGPVLVNPCQTLTTSRAEEGSLGKRLKGIPSSRLTSQFSLKSRFYETSIIRYYSAVPYTNPETRGTRASSKPIPVPANERIPLPPHASPATVFDHKVMYNDLSEDVHQREVVARFQSLYEKIGTYRPKTSASLFSMLFPGPSSRRWQLSGGGERVPRGIYLWGTVGGGKTMLMDMFFDTLEGLDAEIKKRRIHYYDFMQEVHTRMHEAKKKAPPRDISRWDTYQPFDPVPPVGDTILAETWILCLDEFQVTDIADAMILRQLFAYLFDKGLILVATSNRPPNDLYKNGIQRSNFLPFIEMLKEKSHVVSLDPGVDYRRQSLAGSDKLFFVTSNPEDEAEASLTAMFKFLAAKETDTVKPVTIRIKGRDVHFDKGCGGVLDTSFKEICERPLWTNDYLKLTQVFHTIIIHDIPYLSQQNKSQARRFICLVDTLYDHKIRIVASGVAPFWELFQNERISDAQRLQENRELIDDLGLKAAGSGSLDSGVFSGEEELFAFDRTISRLTEMQSKDYWNQWKSYVENQEKKS
ncbi:putative ATPase N2B isoform X3 [Eurytemora carolleeae]|uniref:putative ATPase N2B isoform X3 n=1 Tax=Eurytemora carolleeae TaxID=1294199 RepID=UPI000C77E463|nr:putative ATPase N2B isoform X3 [Eurytemora carolleeae]|eukprot:XP_023341378.1 putative ATPase N2B isoform X3 [Eurytemora affinis]